MNDVKPENANQSSWESVPRDIMVPVPIKMHSPVILDHNLPIAHNQMPVPQTPHVNFLLIRVKNVHILCL